MLLRNGAQPSPWYLDDSTPLIRAAKEGKRDAVRLLLTHGASISEKDRYEKTAFHGAMSNGHVMRLCSGRLMVKHRRSACPESAQALSTLVGANEIGHPFFKQRLRRCNSGRRALLVEMLVNTLVMFVEIVALKRNLLSIDII